MTATMASPGPEGNRRPGFFPRLLQGLCGAYEFQPARTQESALEQRFDSLVEFLKRGFALDLLAIDEKGRGRINLHQAAGKHRRGCELVEQCLILEAILDRLLAETGLLAHGHPGLRWVDERLILRLPEQHVDDREIFS